MARFIIRRSISTVVVLIAISIVTFLIFEAIPNGDPAARLAGRTSTPETVAAIRHTWGFDKPIYDQYLLTMKNVFTGNVISYTHRSTSSTSSSRTCRRRCRWPSARASSGWSWAPGWACSAPCGRAGCSTAD